MVVFADWYLGGGHDGVWDAVRHVAEHLPLKVVLFHAKLFTFEHVSFGHGDYRWPLFLFAYYSRRSSDVRVGYSTLGASVRVIARELTRRGLLLGLGSFVVGFEALVVSVRLVEERRFLHCLAVRQIWSRFQAIRTTCFVVWRVVCAASFTHMTDSVWWRGRAYRYLLERILVAGSQYRCLIPFLTAFSRTSTRCCIDCDDLLLWSILDEHDVGSVALLGWCVDNRCSFVIVFSSWNTWCPMARKPWSKAFIGGFWIFLQIKLVLHQACHSPLLLLGFGRGGLRRQFLKWLLVLLLCQVVLLSCHAQIFIKIVQLRHGRVYLL